MRTKKSVEIKRFDNFDKNSTEIQTTKFYNYFPNSKLNNACGIVSAMFPKNKTNKTEKELKIDSAGITNIQGLAFFKQYFPNSKRTTLRLLVYADDQKVYVNQLVDDMYDLFWLYDLTFDTAPIVLSFKKDEEDAVILASETMMKVWRTGYSPYTIENVPIITSMCANEGVLFCTIKDPSFKIWYATDLNAENIGNISNTSGYITLEDGLGDARKILTFKEEVYVIRDYGISKISFIKKEATVSQVYHSNTKIYANTVCACGNNILFMTNDGLFSFNGIKVNKTNIDLINRLPIENVGATASSLGQKYYLALKVDFEDDKIILNEEGCVNNALFVINTEDFSYEIIRGVDVQSFLPVKTDYFEKMLTIFNSGPVNRIGEVVNASKFMENNLPKFWSSDILTENVRTKLFTKLSVFADKNVKFTLVCDGKEINFTSYCDGNNEFIFKTICKDIKLEISSNEESAIVKSVVLDYYEY